MALGSSASTKRASTLAFIAEVDRNSLRKTLRGFGDLRKSVDQFARAEIESARVANQLNRTNAEQKTGVSRLSNEFDELRREMLQASDAADKLDSSLDQAARQRKLSGVAGGGSLRADIGGIGDVETAGRAIGGGLGAAGFTQADRAIATFSELPATIEAVGQLKQALGKDMKLAFDSLKNSIGGAGLGLIGATVALAAAYALASRATAKAKQALAEELEARNEFARIIRTQTSEQIQDRLQEIAIEQEISEAQRTRAEEALKASERQTESLGFLGEGIVRLSDAVNISDSTLDALQAEFDRTSEATSKLTVEQNVLTEALEAQARAARDVSHDFSELGPEFKAAVQDMLGDAFESNDEAVAFAQSILATGKDLFGNAVDQDIIDQLTVARGADLEARAAERDAIKLSTNSIAILRRQREEETEAVLHAQQKRDLARRNQAAREAEAAKQAEQSFNIFQAAAEKFAKLQQQIVQIQQAASAKLAQIASALAAKRAEAAIKFEQALETAAIAGAEARLRIQETLQDAQRRLMRTFNRANLNSIGERDALANLMARQQRDDSEDDAQQAASRASEQQRRAEVERLRIIRQGNANALRTMAQAAQRQAQLAIQAAQTQIAIRQQQMQAETAIMAQFAVSGVRSIQQFVAGALGALGALAGAAGGAGSSSLNSQIDDRIERTFRGGRPF